MDNEIKTWLFDILESIKEIESYYEGKPKIFKELLADTKTRRAIERNIEIMGEAMNRVIKRDPTFSMQNAYNIIGIRNRVAHAYDSISYDIFGVS